MFSETKCHSRDPKATKFDPNDPKAKQTYVPPSETFEEYMKRRAAGGKQAPVAAASSSSSSVRVASVASKGGYSAMFLR